MWWRPLLPRRPVGAAAGALTRQVRRAMSGAGRCPLATRFDDKVAWITGGGSGIGAALAMELAGRGAAVAVSGRRQDRLDAVVARIEAAGGVGLAIRCDVTDEAGLQAAAGRVADELGGIDICVANAGFGIAGRFETLTGDDWRRQLEVNVVGAAQTAAAALPYLVARKGRLVFMGSVIIFAPMPGNAAYAASKGAIAALGQTLYAELARDGVSCTTIHPGFVASEIGQVDNDGVFHSDARDKRPGWLIVPTDKAARAIADAIHARRRERVITGHGLFIAFLGRHAPDLVSAILRRS